jgi:glycerol-3-phosphate cytidylyltransferase
MCDTFILLKYIRDNNIKKITVNLDIDIDVDIDVDDDENKHRKDYDIAPQKDNYYSMLCFKDLRMFAPHVVTEIYLSKKIENPRYIDALKYTTNMFCKNKEMYKYYLQLKTAASVSSEHIGQHFPNLFYIKFHKRGTTGDIIDAPIFIKDKYDKGITFGTFDLFHYGHNNILTRCKNFCNYLYIGLSSDELNERKGKISIDKYEKRKEVIEKVCYGDEIFKEESLEHKNDYVLQTGAEILMMGDDWLGEFDWVSCDVLYMERTPNISTTLLKTIRKIMPENI